MEIARLKDYWKEQSKYEFLTGVGVCYFKGERSACIKHYEKSRKCGIT